MSLLFWAIWSLSAVTALCALPLILSERLSARDADGVSLLSAKTKQSIFVVMAISGALVTLAHFCIGAWYGVQLVLA